MKFFGRNEEFFEVVEVDKSNAHILSETGQSELTLIWFDKDGSKLSIDGIPYTFNKNQLISLTQFQKVDYEAFESGKMIRFNKAFYCVVNHDSEVGCKGILFFGSSQLPIMKPSDQEIELLDAVWNMLVLEMRSKDELQLEMLQMMLKRILILCTRVYKQQEGWSSESVEKIDIIRSFNYLVEQHFKDKHTVSEYASLLHKSPKTLANSFKKLGVPSPLNVIRERIMLEARRLLTYTEMTISDIAYEIGYPDVQTFSRIFRQKVGSSPTAFRQELNKVA